MFSKRKANITPGEPQFSVRYVGKIETYTSGGSGCTSLPVQTLWDNSVDEKRMKKVDVLINSLGIQLFDSGGKAAKENFPIENISFYSSGVPNHDRIFSWVFREPATGKMNCHVVICSSKEKAQQMAMTMSGVFQIAYKDWKHSQGKMSREKCISHVNGKSKANDSSTQLHPPTRSAMNITDDMSVSDNVDQNK